MNKNEDLGFEIFNVSAIVLNNILLKKDLLSKNKIELSDLKDSLTQGIWIGFEVNNNTTKLIETACIVSSSASIPAAKEILLLPENRCLISFRVFKLIIDQQSIAQKKEPKPTVEELQLGSFLDKLKVDEIERILTNKLSITQLDKDFFSIVGTASKNTWELLSTEFPAYTEFRANKGLDEKVMGHMEITSQGLVLMKDIYDSGVVENFNKDVEHLIKQEGD